MRRASADGSGNASTRLVWPRAAHARVGDGPCIASCGVVRRGNDARAAGLQLAPAAGCAQAPFGLAVAAGALLSSVWPIGRYLSGGRRGGRAQRRGGGDFGICLRGQILPPLFERGVKFRANRLICPPPQTHLPPNLPYVNSRQIQLGVEISHM
jgi:hypothetical protein